MQTTVYGYYEDINYKTLNTNFTDFRLSAKEFSTHQRPFPQTPFVSAGRLAFHQSSARVSSEQRA